MTGITDRVHPIQNTGCDAVDRGDSEQVLFSGCCSLCSVGPHPFEVYSLLKIWTPNWGSIHHLLPHFEGFFLTFILKGRIRDLNHRTALELSLFLKGVKF